MNLITRDIQKKLIKLHFLLMDNECSGAFLRPVFYKGLRKLF